MTGKLVRHTQVQTTARYAHPASKSVKHIASLQQRADGCFLARAGPLEPEYVPQHLACGSCLLL